MLAVAGWGEITPMDYLVPVGDRVPHIKPGKPRCKDLAAIQRVASSSFTDVTHGLPVLLEQPTWDGDSDFTLPCQLAARMKGAISQINWPLIRHGDGMITGRSGLALTGHPATLHL
jgi:hypothetical protein